MSPLMIRLFTLVGIALAAASMQMKSRAGTLAASGPQQVQAAAPAQPGAIPHHAGPTT